MSVTWLYTIAFAVTAVCGFVLTAFSIKVAHRYKFLDYPSQIKLHGRPIPYLGGTAIFAAFWLMAWAIYTILGNPQIQHYFEGTALSGFDVEFTSFSAHLPVIFAGSLLILILGIVDDRFVLKAYVKFAGQILIALMIVGSGMQIECFSNLGMIGQAITLVWIVLLLNAFNFIDSIDGHCAGVVLIACGALFMVSQFIGQPVLGVTMAILSGAIIGFLPFNFKHAKTFLGDNGSLFLGYMMAVVSVESSYHAIQPVMMAPIVPLFVFGVPIYDLLSVVSVRLYRGIAPWKGDRNHFAHRLVRMGMKGQDAILFSYIVGIATGLVAVLSTQIASLRGHAIVLLLYFMILMIIAILEYYSVLQRNSEIS